MPLFTLIATSLLLVSSPTTHAALAPDQFSASASLEPEGQADLIAQTKSKDAKTREQAARELGRTCGGSHAGILALVQLLSDPSDEVEAEARRAIMRLGDKAVPGLLEAVDHESPAVRFDAVRTLGMLEPDSTLAVERLRELLGYPDGTLAAQIALAFWRQGGPRALAVEALLALAMDQEKSVIERTCGLMALAEMGHDARAAHDVLRALIDDESVMVRRAAIYSIGETGTNSAAVIVRVLAGIEDKDVGVRKLSARALGRIGTTPEIARALAKQLNDPEVCMDALSGLRLMGPAAAVATSALCDAMDGPDAESRVAAISAIEAIGPGSKAAIPALIKLLQQKDVKVRLAAAKALAGMGSAAKTSIPSLLEPLKDDAEIRPFLAQVVIVVGSDARAATGPLLELLKDVSTPRRDWLARALGAIGKDAESAMPTLVGCLHANDDRLRLQAAVALIRIKGSDREAQRVLEGYLQGEDMRLRLWAAEGLWMVTHCACLVLPTLVEGLEDRANRGFTVFVAGALGSEAIELAPTLRRLLRKNPEIREIAVRALAEIVPSSPK